MILRKQTNNQEEIKQTPVQRQNSTPMKSSKTLLRIKYDAGFSNTLFIRGKGGGLSWDKGIPLKNVKADEWVWETSNLTGECEYKILINDKNFETGENHHLHPGSTIQIIPQF
jgi:hypothetical protein